MVKNRSRKIFSTKFCSENEQSSSHGENNDSGTSCKFDEKMCPIDIASPDLFKTETAHHIKPKVLFPTNYSDISSDFEDYYEDDLFESDADDEIWKKIEECKAQSNKPSGSNADPCSSTNTKRKKFKKKRSRLNFDIDFSPEEERWHIDERLKTQKLIDKNFNLRNQQITEQIIDHPEVKISQSPSIRLKHDFENSTDFQYFVLNVLPGLDMESEDEDVILKRIEEDERLEKEKFALLASKEAIIVKSMVEKRKKAKLKKQPISKLNAKQKNKPANDSQKLKPKETKLQHKFVERKTGSTASKEKKSLTRSVHKPCLKIFKEKRDQSHKAIPSKQKYKRMKPTIKSATKRKSDQSKAGRYKSIKICTLPSPKQVVNRTGRSTPVSLQHDQPKQKKQTVVSAPCPSLKISKTSKQNLKQKNESKLKTISTFQNHKQIKYKNSKPLDKKTSCSARSISCSRSSKSFTSLKPNLKSEVKNKRHATSKTPKQHLVASSTKQKCSGNRREKYKLVEACTLSNAKQDIDSQAIYNSSFQLEQNNPKKKKEKRFKIPAPSLLEHSKNILNKRPKSNRKKAVGGKMSNPPRGKNKFLKSSATLKPDFKASKKQKGRCVIVESMNQLYKQMKKTVATEKKPKKAIKRKCTLLSSPNQHNQLTEQKIKSLKAYALSLPEKKHYVKKRCSFEYSKNCLKEAPKNDKIKLNSSFKPSNTCASNKKRKLKTPTVPVPHKKPKVTKSEGYNRIAVLPKKYKTSILSKKDQILKKNCSHVANGVISIKSPIKRNKKSHVKSTKNKVDTKK